jgi:hypothetical protein
MNETKKKCEKKAFITYSTEEKKNQASAMVFYQRF